MFHFHFSFYSFDIKLLISLSKFSGSRKSTLRYQQFWTNFHLGISRVDTVIDIVKLDERIVQRTYQLLENLMGEKV